MCEIAKPENAMNHLTLTVLAAAMDSLSKRMDMDHHTQWLYGQPVYSRWCAENGWSTGDPDAMHEFLRSWEPGFFEDGICLRCGDSCAAEWSVACPDTGWREFLYTECCRARMLEIVDGEPWEVA